MTYLKIKNRAVSTLASDVTDVATSWTVATGEGAKFPTTGDFHITCEDEIVKCTARSGDVLAVTRGQEGTSAAAHSAGKSVELRITAGVLESRTTWTADKLLKGAGAGADPTEIDVPAAGWAPTGDGGTKVAGADCEATLEDPIPATAGLRTLGAGAQQAAPGNHTHTLVLTQEWSDELSAGGGENPTGIPPFIWETMREKTVSSSKKIVVWLQAKAQKGGMEPCTSRLLVNDVERARSGAETYDHYSYGVSYGGIGGVVKAQVRSEDSYSAYVRCGMWSVGI